MVLFSAVGKLLQPVRGRRRRGEACAHPALEALEDRVVPSATYDVGSGQPYATIGAVPWDNLGPGDTVRIHGQAQAYHEKILLSASGTASQPIHILGVPGSDGQLPVIDGQNATTRRGDVYPYAPTQDRGLLTITRNPGQPYGYIPSYLDIEGLNLRNAYTPYTFTDAYGAVRTYTANAAALYVERGQHITISNCTLSGSGNGLFVSSGTDAASLSKDILVQGCDIYGNGNVGSDREHNVYTEAIGITFQYNHLGLLRPGALGNNLKDRSAGTVIRYNWIEAGGHMLDLVDPQDSAWAATQDPSFHQTYVYGNIFMNGPGSQGTGFIVHYGGDDYVYQDYRKGTLFFYDNTVVVQADQVARWRTILLQLDTNDESADVRNNIVYTQAATPGATPTELDLMASAGNASFGVNWVSPGWQISTTYGGFQGTVAGTSNFLVDPKNDPGFVNLASGDVRLRAGAAPIDRGQPIAPGAANYPVAMQYSDPRAGAARPVVGAAPDLGALEYGAPSGTGFRLTTTANAVAAGGTVNVTVTAVDAYGNRLRLYTGTVHFSSSDRAASLPADYTFTLADGGVHTFAVTLRTAGTQTVTAVQAGGGGSASAHLLVQPGAPARLVVVNRPSSAVGVTFPVAVIAQDAYGNTATGYTGTVHFSSTDPSGALPADYTFTAADRGVRLFNVTLRTGGARSLSAADKANAGLTGTLGVAVSPVVRFVITLPGSTTAGAAFTFTVSAVDQYGNVVPGYTGTVHFSCTDPYILPPGDYTFTAADGGTHTFTLALKIARQQTVYVADTAYGGITGSASTFVAPAGFYGFLIQAAPNQTAGTPFTVTLTAADQYGNTVTGYTGTVRFSSTDTGAQLPAGYTFLSTDRGVFSFSVTLSSTGTQKVAVVDTLNKYTFTSVLINVQ